MPGAIRPPFDPSERELIPLQQLSGTLLNLALYLALVVLGAFLGSRPAVQSRPMPWLGRFQTAALLLLIVTLGAELGANDEIVTSLATIGLNALIITLTSMSAVCWPSTSAEASAEAGCPRGAPGRGRQEETAGKRTRSMWITASPF